MWTVSPDRGGLLTDPTPRPTLNGTAPPPPYQTPEHLLVPTRCRVLRPFLIKGERQEVDTIVTVPKHDADYLAGVRKVEVL